MQMNHHILAKTTTDAILEKFKSEQWLCANRLGRDFFRVTTDASFPSPDAAFYDEQQKFLVSFEFKPPTETKRGILTGVGQSIAYLKECNVSYLIAPERLEDFNLGGYLSDLYQTQIYGKIPTGLILYKNDKPSEVNLVSDIASTIATSSTTNLRKRGITESRYWAKHQDLPIPLFHLLLHCYFLKKTNVIADDAFKYCWTHYMISPTILTDFRAVDIFDCSGQVIKTPAGNKNLRFLEKTLNKYRDLPIEEKVARISHEIDTEYVGDNKFNSYKKNFVSFLKHLRVIDSAGGLTDSGFVLYHLGLANGPSSKVFKDYFTKEVLTTGHHLDLLIDLDNTIRDNPDLTFKQCQELMENSYEMKGFIKRNPNRQTRSTSSVDFLKYECILWRALGLLTVGTRQKSYVNWKLVTEICSLPDLY